MAAELLTITLAANQRRTFERGGRYLEIIEGENPVDLILYGPQGEQQDEARAIVSGLFLEQRDPFARFDVQNGTVAQTLRLLVTDGRAGSRRQPGTVQVVDGGRARTLNNQAFIGYASITGSAGQVPVIQLRNPPGSSVRAMVKAIRASSSLAGFLRIERRNAPAALGPFPAPSKRIGGADAVTQVWRESIVPPPGGTTTFEVHSVQASTMLPVPYTEPLALSPGDGLIVSCDTVASLLLATFEFTEEPVS